MVVGAPLPEDGTEEELTSYLQRPIALFVDEGVVVGVAVVVGVDLEWIGGVAVAEAAGKPVLLFVVEQAVLFQVVVVQGGDEGGRLVGHDRYGGDGDVISERGIGLER